jgi:hypothetical protein
MPAVPQHISVKLTQAQRQVVAEVAPGLADRLKLAERNQRAIRFTLTELEAIRQKVGAALRHAITGRKENALRHVLDAATHVIEHLRGAGSNPGSRRLYQFKITLLDTRPPVWRRIQVKDCTLDKLHEHVQTAMGWTNSHPPRLEEHGGMVSRITAPAAFSSARQGRTPLGRPAHCWRG